MARTKSHAQVSTNHSQGAAPPGPIPSVKHGAHGKGWQLDKIGAQAQGGKGTQVQQAGLTTGAPLGGPKSRDTTSHKGEQPWWEPQDRACPAAFAPTYEDPVACPPEAASSCSEASPQHSTASTHWEPDGSPSRASSGWPPGGGDKARATTDHMGRRNSPELGDDKPTTMTHTEGLLCAGSKLSTVRCGFFVPCFHIWSLKLPYTFGTITTGS